MRDGSSFPCRNAEPQGSSLDLSGPLGTWDLQRTCLACIRCKEALIRLWDSIRNWFEDVCPAWSAFDSGMNMNRKLAADLWHSSAAVFNALLTGQAIGPSTSMRGIEEAQRLEEKLQEVKFATIPQMNETGHWRAPRLHLARVAETYQLASLIQLYVTFPDLVSLRLPHESA